MRILWLSLIKTGVNCLCHVLGCRTSKVARKVLQHAVVEITSEDVGMPTERTGSRSFNDQRNEVALESPFRLGPTRQESSYATWWITQSASEKTVPAECKREPCER